MGPSALPAYLFAIHVLALQLFCKHDLFGGDKTDLLLRSFALKIREERL